jgi:Protein of unknown function (DUF2798)
MNASNPCLDRATTKPALRIPKRYAGIVFALLMSTSISALMSAAITLLNTGWDAGFLGRWLHAYALSWSMAFPIVATVAPRVRRLVDQITA